ncbi:MAG: pilus assembly protein PilO [Paenibacillaceae bacterium]|nr:pilus assembly protein PilO [Paenibacillaceae bacterium]
MLLIIPLVLVIVYVYAVKPINEELTEVQQGLHNKQKELKALQAKLDGNNSFGGKDRVVLDQVRGSVPEAPYVEELIRDFRMLEVVSGLKMDSYNILVTNTAASGAASAGQEKPEVWSTLALPIKMSTTVRGSYPQVYRLLSELKTARRIIQVESIHFTAQTGYPVKLNAPGKEISSTITFVAYYAPGLSQFYKQAVPTDAVKPAGRSNPMH